MAPPFFVAWPGFGAPFEGEERIPEHSGASSLILVWSGSGAFFAVPEYSDACSGSQLKTVLGASSGGQVGVVPHYYASTLRVERSDIVSANQSIGLDEPQSKSVLLAAVIFGRHASSDSPCASRVQLGWTAHPH